MPLPLTVIFLNQSDLQDIREDAEFTASRIGAPDSPIRLRALNILKLLDEREIFKRCANDYKEILEKSSQQIAEISEMVRNLKVSTPPNIP